MDLKGIKRRKWEIERLNRPSPEQIRKYYGGFNMINRSPMYKDEIDDLEDIYEKTLDELEMQNKCSLPSLLFEMECFLSLHGKKKEITEKLHNLRAKKESQCT